SAHRPQLIGRIANPNDATSAGGIQRGSAASSRIKGASDYPGHGSCAARPNVSLRLRLFVLFGVLLVLLGAAELLLVRSLTQRLTGAVGEGAGALGRRRVRFMGKGLPPPPIVEALPKQNARFLSYTTESHTMKVDGKEVVQTEVHVETDDPKAPLGRRLHV